MINNYLELIDIKKIEYTEEYDNVVDITVDIDESFLLSNGIISHNSAKSTAKAGISVVGNDYYGIFPLKGKPLNVRDISISKMRENDEIRDIVNILGLEIGKNYTSTRTLRYGKVILMTDADCIEENTLILTKRGYIKIKDINYDDEVLTHTSEWKKVINIIETNKENVVKIMINNIEYIFSENHELPVFRNGSVILVKVKDILSSDKILKKKSSD